MLDILRADDGIPIVLGTARPIFKPGTKLITTWQVRVTCPYCGKPHFHATGNPEGPKEGEYIGHLATKCSHPDGYHVLVNATGS